MKKQNFKAPLMVSGLFIGTLLAALTGLFLQFEVPEMSWLQGLTINQSLNQALQPARNQQTIRIPPLAGHWLRTAQDLVPAVLHPGTAYTAATRLPQGYGGGEIMPVDRPADRFMNRTTENINIMYVWTDGPQLKVISVTSFNKKTRQAAIMVIPLYTRISPDGATIGDLYQEEGRAGVQKYLEKQLEISIPNFVHVSQEALRKLSELVGSFNINGEPVTMADAFEETATGTRTDDREIVKAVGSRVLTPGMLIKVPSLIWIFTHNIKTNFSPEEMLQLFNLSRSLNLGEMKKITLPGVEIADREGPSLFVYSETWKNIIYDVTL